MPDDQKLAKAHAKVHDLIRRRWSPRAFSNKEVSADDLASILDAARWAASSYNEQPWRFIVATKKQPAEYEKLLSFLVPFNQAWAKTAPVLILTLAKKSFSHNHEPNKHAMHDAGAALTTLFLQATALGLHAHGMAGFDVERAAAELKIPDDFQPAAFAAIGYIGEASQLPEAAQKQELAARERKPLSELVFTTDWQTPFEF